MASPQLEKQDDVVIEIQDYTARPLRTMAESDVVDDYMDMAEVIPNLWLGDLRNATNSAILRSKRIQSILTVMNGNIKVGQTFKRYQIEVVDTEEEDLLKHLVSAIQFIHNELENGRGVLVHCAAGVSRSVAVVAAYLMYTRGLTAVEAVRFIRKVRPVADPNSGFMAQLEIFHKASYKVSKQDKSVRMFYLERLVKSINNGDGSFDLEDLPNYTNVVPVQESVVVANARRRIRCKMCRTELASRENMVEHGQLSPPRPAVSYSPTVSTPPSFPEEPGPLVDAGVVSREALESPHVNETEELADQLAKAVTLTDLPVKQHANTPATVESNGNGNLSTDAVADSTIASSTTTRPPGASPPARPQKATSSLSHPSELAAQVYSNPTLAALRTSSVRPPSLKIPPNPSLSIATSVLVNPKCSGYFVEPMKWMDPFLEQGQTSGKILCPNKKCKAKLGNFDWAGVCCSCKEWVVPGFCIHRSKVDEIL